jgi:hypothetical protein
MLHDLRGASVGRRHVLPKVLVRAGEPRRKRWGSLLLRARPLRRRRRSHAHETHELGGIEAGPRADGAPADDGDVEGHGLLRRPRDRVESDEGQRRCRRRRRYPSDPSRERHRASVSGSMPSWAAKSPTDSPLSLSRWTRACHPGRTCSVTFSVTFAIAHLVGADVAGDDAACPDAVARTSGGRARRPGWMRMQGADRHRMLATMTWPPLTLPAASRAQSR